MEKAEEQLLAQESIKYSTHPHWMIFTMPVTILGLALFLGFLNPLLLIMAYLLAAAGLFSLVLSAITYRYTEYLVTNLRLIKKFGFIARKTYGVPLNKIESIDTEQTVLGRVFGFGSVLVTGTGGTREVIFNIPRPFEFRTQLQQSINQ